MVMDGEAFEAMTGLVGWVSPLLGFTRARGELLHIA